MFFERNTGLDERFLRYGQPGTEGVVQVLEILTQTRKPMNSNGRVSKFDRDPYISDLERISYEMINDQRNYVVAKRLRVPNQTSAIEVVGPRAQVKVQEVNGNSAPQEGRDFPCMPKFS